MGCFEQLNLNTQAHSVRLGGDAQLLLVASTRDARKTVLELLLPLVGLLQQLLGCCGAGVEFRVLLVSA